MRTAFAFAMISLLAVSGSALAIAEPNQPLQDRLDQANTPEARQAIERFGTCTAKLQPSEAKRLLAMDFTSAGYRTGLRLLATETERKCAYGSIGRGKMRSSNLLFSGAMAEALLEADSTPLNSRLARSANARVSSYSPTDTVAQCLARSLPDQVATLFATPPGSDPEKAAAAPLTQAVPVCARTAGIAAKVEVTVPALRAMIATAAYRLIAHSGSTNTVGEAAK